MGGEGETPKQLEEKVKDQANDIDLLNEQLNAREGQLTAVQTRLSELEHENEMMSDRDDQIITLRDELQVSFIVLSKFY